jgi:hypothetical protein
MDVGETEVEVSLCPFAHNILLALIICCAQELFKKTVGPLRESFLIYNSQGKSKGMAVVVFQRPGDAVVARSKYDGKIVDGREFDAFYKVVMVLYFAAGRPIKIEVIVESGASVPSTTPSAPPQPPSLFDRLQANGPVAGPSKVAPVAGIRPGGPAPMSLRFATPTWVVSFSSSLSERDSLWQTTAASCPAYRTTTPRYPLQLDFPGTYSPAEVSYEERTEAAQKKVGSKVEGATGQRHGGLSSIRARRNGLTIRLSFCRCVLPSIDFFAF